MASDSNRSIAEAYYVHLKLCRDILVDPTKRFAWQKSTTIPDYMTAGIRNLFYYYTGTAGVLTIIGFMGYIKQAAFWRFLALASLGVFELHCLMSPEFPRLLTKIVNPVLTLIPLHPQFLPFQLLSLLRKLILTLFIAFSQIGPLLTPSTPAPPSEDQIQQQQLQRLGAIAGGLETQANMLMALEMTPFTDESDMRELRERLKRFLVDNTIRSNKEVRDAMGGVLARRRQGAPHGAAGTR